MKRNYRNLYDYKIYFDKYNLNIVDIIFPVINPCAGEVMTKSSGRITTSTGVLVPNPSSTQGISIPGSDLESVIHSWPGLPWAARCPDRT